MNTLESMDYFEYLSIKEAADELEELEALAQEWELYHNQESECFLSRTHTDRCHSLRKPRTISMTMWSPLAALRTGGPRCTTRRGSTMCPQVDEEQALLGYDEIGKVPTIRIVPTTLAPALGSV